MIPERWPEVEDLYGRVADLPEEERGRILAQVDVTLRQQVEAILSGDGSGATLLRRAIEDAAELLAKPAARHFGPYTVTGTIGHGGMGAVFKAIRDDQVYQKQVAIKVIHVGLESPEVLQRFRQERQILAALEHPNITRLLDGGETDEGLPYIVLEYLEGEPITTYCQSRKLSSEARLRLFLQVCGAVQYAHRNLIVHRDLKPANILVTRDGTPKLLDFGIARLLDTNAARTVTAFQALTPDYASPEQVRGLAISTSSDVYSLGVVLYELLTERQPYKLDTISMAELNRVICERPPAPPELGDELDDILLMALRKEPERRYGSVQCFADDIERYLDHRPVSARPDRLGYRTGKFVRRNRLGLAAAALVLLVLTGGIVASQRQARRAERRFGQVRELANVFLFDLDAQIRDVPGTTRARETLVRTALRYLDSLAGEAADDSTLQRELGIAYGKVAAVQGQPGNPNLGQTAEALVSYRKALDHLRAAARLQPRDVLAEDIADTLLNLNGIELAMANTTGARTDLEEGLNTLRRGGSSSVRRLQLTVSLNIKLSGIHNNLGQPDRAIATSDEAIRAARELVGHNQAADSYKLLGDSYTESALAHQNSGDLRAALAQMRQAVSTLEKAERLDPGRSSIQRSLFSAYELTGNIAGNPTGMNLGDRKAAFEAYRHGLALSQTAASADSNNHDAQRQLAIACLNIADEFTLTDPPEAIHYYTKMIGIMDRLRAHDAGNLTFQRMGALGEVSLVEVLLTQHQPQAALPYMTRALSTARRLVKADVNRVHYARDLTNAIRISGEVRLALGEHDAAVSAMNAALEEARKISEAHPADNQSRAILAGTLRSLGHLYETSRQLRNLGKARLFYSQELDIWQKWPSRTATSVYDQKNLSAALAALERCSRPRNGSP